MSSVRQVSWVRQNILSNKRGSHVCGVGQTSSWVTHNVHSCLTQGLWRIEYLNTGSVKTEICKQTGVAFREGGFYVSLVCKTCENYLVWL